MPPKPHFVTTEELSNLRGKHQIMSEEVRQWLQTETNRVNNTTQYRIQGRSSMDDIRYYKCEPLLHVFAVRR